MKLIKQSCFERNDKHYWMSHKSNLTAKNKWLNKNFAERMKKGFVMFILRQSLS